MFSKKKKINKIIQTTTKKPTHLGVRQTNSSWYLLQWKNKGDYHASRFCGWDLSSCAHPLPAQQQQWLK